MSAAGYPLQLPNLDPKRAPTRVEVDWKCTTGPVRIGPEQRTVCLLRGKYGEVQVRTLRVQFPKEGLPADFESYQAVWASDVLVGKRGIVVAHLQGRCRATCHVDLPPPADVEMLVEPALSNCFNRPYDPPKDFWQWAGQRATMRATHRGLALVVWANYPTFVEAMIGGV